ncbi:MAG: stage IV sporulation protein A [Oscillospiraceae bacterium]|nr:stage IV sporulation protein A [Oscillospiraceae bacterium]
MSNTSIYQDIAERTGGNVYIGVVGPVRTGKSTFIKRFMETLVIPNIESLPQAERARDELPQSGSGRTIMTAEPKFVPENAVSLTLSGADVSVRLIDSVGYMVDGALGEYEGESARMVATPWFDREVTLKEAAEAGTRKVITEHSTVGIVVTTDGTIGEIDRASYEEAERRVISELKELDKPFLVLLNTAYPESEKAKELGRSLSEEYGVACAVKNCLEMTTEDIESLITTLLFEFPVTGVGVYLPSWVETLPEDSGIRADIYKALLDNGSGVRKISQVSAFNSGLTGCEVISGASVIKTDLGTGFSAVSIDVPRELFYKTVSEQSGLCINDDGDIMTSITELSSVKADYDKVKEALNDVREKGYGIVMPSRDELTLQEPEIIRRGGRYGVRLKASAPSIHMIRADVETEVSPGIGGGSSEDIIGLLLQDFEGDTSKLWESNVFGKPLYDIAGEGLSSKIRRMPEESREKLQEALGRIINEGSSGLICIIL